MTEEKKIVETVDENGNAVNFELVDIIDFEEREYALLLSANSADNEEDEIVVMRLLTDDEGYTFETIEDDDEFERVAAYLDTLDDEDEDDEE